MGTLIPVCLLTGEDPIGIVSKQKQYKEGINMKLKKIIELSDRDTDAVVGGSCVCFTGRGCSGRSCRGTASSIDACAMVCQSDKSFASWAWDGSCHNILR